MALPPSHFEELENVTMLLMTKTTRVGRNFSYSLGNPDETVVYTIVEEELRYTLLSKICWDDPRLPLKLKITYGDAEVMRLERVPAQSTCFNLRPYTMAMGVFAPAGNLIGHVRRQNFYSIRDENRQQIMNIRPSNPSMFGPMPMKVCRMNTQTEPVALVGRRNMFEPLEGVRTTPPQRYQQFGHSTELKKEVARVLIPDFYQHRHRPLWGVRFLEAPISLKEKLLVIAAVLHVDYLEPPINVGLLDPFAGNRGWGRGWGQRGVFPTRF